SLRGTVSEHMCRRGSFGGIQLADAPVCPRAKRGYALCGLVFDAAGDRFHALAAANGFARDVAKAAVRSRDLVGDVSVHELGGGCHGFADPAGGFFATCTKAAAGVPRDESERKSRAV